MKLNHHGNFKVQHFQLFEHIKKDDCAPRSTVPHLPLYVNYAGEIYQVTQASLASQFIKKQGFERKASVENKFPFALHCQQPEKDEKILTLPPCQNSVVPMRKCFAQAIGTIEVCIQDFKKLFQ